QMDLFCIAFSKAVLVMNLAPNEKWNLLFNVNFLLEILVNDFDNIWWPLVSNIRTQ
ncbi:10756_t:CDS:1, partial [Dentiscutata erythropus]